MNTKHHNLVSASINRVTMFSFRRRQLLSPTGFRLMVKENGTVMGTRTDYDIEGILEVATEESLDDRVEDDDVKKAFADARANGKSSIKNLALYELESSSRFTSISHLLFLRVMTLKVYS